MKNKTGVLQELKKIFKSLLVIFPLMGEKLKRLFHFSLSFKISIIYSLLIILSFFFFSLAASGLSASFLINEAHDQLALSLDSFSQNIEARDNLIIPNDKISLYLFDLEENMIWKSRTDFPSFPLKEANNRYQISLSRDKSDFYLIKARDDLTASNFYLRGAFKINQLLRTSFLFGGILFLLSLILFILLPLSGFRLSRKILQPIKKMTHDAKDISLLNIDKRLDVSKSHDELKDLSETFNEMLDRLQASYEKQYQFISDVSHELRTPLSVIQGYANLLARWGKDDKEVLDQSLEAIIKETENMKELIEKLLFIARSENKDQELDKEVFNIEELLEEIVKDYQILDTGHDFQVETEKNLSLYADRGLIKQALRIFTDNAVKFTPSQGEILLSAKKSRDKLIFTIKDNGLGINKEDLPKIFDRFYRSDSSRDKSSGGSGLGLSIAKIILDLHQAKIKVFSQPGQGTEIELLFDIKEIISRPRP